MLQIYEAQIVNFTRKKMNQGGIELKIRVNVEGFDNVHFWSPVVYPNQKNPWIDWEVMNTFGEPKIKKEAGEVLRIQGKMEDYSLFSCTNWVLEGEVIN